MKLKLSRRVALVPLTVLAVAAATTGAGYSGAAPASAAALAPACQSPQPPLPTQELPTTVETIGQAYFCVFANYYSGSTLDDQTLLTAAFEGLTEKLQELGLDRSYATMPALTGNHDTDWEAFAAVYQRIYNSLPSSAQLRQSVAEATMSAMLGSLNDDHVHWIWAPIEPPADQTKGLWGIGIAGMSAQQGNVFPHADPAAAPPDFITEVDPGSPAALSGLRPGDVILAVNGSAPFSGGVFSAGIVPLLNQIWPADQMAQLTVQRPATGRVWTVSLNPAFYTPPVSNPEAKLLDGNIAYVQVPSFLPGIADTVISDIKKLGTGRTLRGVILDVRNNGGGSPTEVSNLVGAFVHGRDIGYLCNVGGSCQALPTTNTEALLHRPLVVLTNRNCGSACDNFATAVKDLKIGTLVGTRTSGDVAGPASEYQLSDNSELEMPSLHYLGPNHEIVDGIGVAPDIYQPITAADLSEGVDPNIATATRLLGL
jgi:carboxyl-terminal processing protease